MLSQFCHHFNSVQFLEDLPRGGPPLLPLTPPTIKPPSIHLPHKQQRNCASESRSVCPTLCDPTDCIVHGILQARILQYEWRGGARHCSRAMGGDSRLETC